MYMNRFLPVFLYFALTCILLVCSCGEKSGEQTQDSGIKTATVDKPLFNADSAYAYIKYQLSFGSRVPGSAAHLHCANWMESKLLLTCDTVFRQETTVIAGNGKQLPCINIIGVINPDAAKRILLLAHWDSRPWADRDMESPEKPILAADDGGSGVAVLLELARQIKGRPIPPKLGIDILMVDVEDYGRTEWGEDSYSLGTQYWALHPHIPGYRADFGILLDMVGARDARFRLEGYSAQFAPAIQQKVWNAAGAAGYSSYFLYESGGYITDDHYFINKLTGIPTIDIINLSNHPENPFAAHWHTHQDDISVIDKQTLLAVGETLLHVIYEMAGSFVAATADKKE